MKDIIGAAMGFSYNLTILGVTVWLVGWKDWSPWLFLLALMLLAHVKVDA